MLMKVVMVVKLGDIILRDPATIPTQFINRIVLRHIDHNGEEALDWCRNNIASDYQFHVSVSFIDQSGRRASIYSFAKKEDAMAFKLMVL